MTTLPADVHYYVRTDSTGERELCRQVGSNRPDMVLGEFEEPTPIFQAAAFVLADEDSRMVQSIAAFAGVSEIEVQRILAGIRQAFMEVR